MREMTEINELERKKKLRKKEERREAGESERKGNVYLMRKGEMCTVAVELNLLDLAPLLHHDFLWLRAKKYHYIYIAPLL